MALTTAQKISLFEILGVPYTGDVDIPIDEFNLDAMTRNASSAEWKLQTKITTRLSAMTADEETVLLSHIAQWDALGYDVTELDGGVGGISGVTDLPDSRRRLIQAKVKTIVPVMRYLEEINQMDRGGGGTAQVAMIR